MDYSKLDANSIQFIIEVYPKKTISIDPSYIYYLPLLDLMIKRERPVELHLSEYGVLAKTVMYVYRKSIHLPFGFKLEYNGISTGVNGQISLEIGCLTQFQKHTFKTPMDKDSFHDIHRESFNKIILDFFTKAIAEHKNVESMPLNELSSIVFGLVKPTFWNVYGLSLNELHIFNRPFEQKTSSNKIKYSIV